MALPSQLSALNKPLVLGLAALALVRPVFSITGWSDDLGRPATPLLLTAAITVAWVLIAGLGRVRDPVLTCVAAGLVYAVATIVLSAVLSPILDGELRGPLAQPLSIVPLLVVNALWGLAAGALAFALRRARGRDRRDRDRSY